MMDIFYVHLGGLRAKLQNWTNVYGVCLFNLRCHFVTTREAFKGKTGI